MKISIYYRLSRKCVTASKGELRLALFFVFWYTCLRGIYVTEAPACFTICFLNPFTSFSLVALSRSFFLLPSSFPPPPLLASSLPLCWADSGGWFGLEVFLPQLERRWTRLWGVCAFVCTWFSFRVSSQSCSNFWNIK